MGNREEICRYFSDDQPECVFGTALHELGIDKSQLVEGRSIGFNLTVLYDAGIVEDFTPQNREWCIKFQIWQDYNYPWGVCEKKTDEGVDPYIDSGGNSVKYCENLDTDESSNETEGLES